MTQLTLLLYYTISYNLFGRIDHFIFKTSHWRRHLQPGALLRIRLLWPTLRKYILWAQPHTYMYSINSNIFCSNLLHRLFSYFQYNYYLQDFVRFSYAMTPVRENYSWRKLQFDHDVFSCGNPATLRWDVPGERLHLVGDRLGRVVLLRKPGTMKKATYAHFPHNKYTKFVLQFKTAGDPYVAAHVRRLRVRPALLRGLLAVLRRGGVRQPQAGGEGGWGRERDFYY